MVSSDGPAPESIGKTSDTPTENIETGTAENQAIIITPAELKEALQPLADQVAEVAQQVAQLTEAAQQAEEPADQAIKPEVEVAYVRRDFVDAICDAIEHAEISHAAKTIDNAETIPQSEEITTQVVENETKAQVEEVKAQIEEIKALVEGIPTQVQEAIEAAKTPSAEEPVPAPIVISEPPVTIEAVEQKVTEQISVALEQHEAKKTEEAKAPIEKTEISQVVSHLAPLIKSNSSSFVLAFLTIICAVGMIISSGLYVTEKSANAQAISQLTNEASQAISQLTNEAFKLAAEDEEKMRLMAQDVVHIHLLKNDNMEQAIQNKMDFLKSQKLPNGESMPDYKAIPMAYLDPEVIKEVAYCLPDSVRKLPYAEELVLIELKRIASYAEKELSKEQHKK